MVSVCWLRLARARTCRLVGNGVFGVVGLVWRGLRWVHFVPGFVDGFATEGTEIAETEKMRWLGLRYGTEFSGRGCRWGFRVSKSGPFDNARGVPPNTTEAERRVLAGWLNRAGWIG